MLAVGRVGHGDGRGDRQGDAVAHSGRRRTENGVKPGAGGGRGDERWAQRQFSIERSEAVEDHPARKQLKDRGEEPWEQEHRRPVDATSGRAHTEQRAPVGVGAIATAGRGGEEMGGLGALHRRGVSRSSGIRAAEEGRKRAAGAGRRPNFVEPLPSARTEDGAAYAARAGRPNRLPPRPQTPVLELDTQGHRGCNNYWRYNSSSKTIQCSRDSYRYVYTFLFFLCHI